MGGTAGFDMICFASLAGFILATCGRWYCLLVLLLARVGRHYSGFSNTRGMQRRSFFFTPGSWSCGVSRQGQEGQVREVTDLFIIRHHVDLGKNRAGRGAALLQAWKEHGNWEQQGWG